MYLSLSNRTCTKLPAATPGAPGAAAANGTARDRAAAAALGGPTSARRTPHLEPAWTPVLGGSDDASGRRPARESKPSILRALPGTHRLWGTETAQPGTCTTIPRWPRGERSV